MAFRQRVDFYYWKGIPVARSWPVYHPYTPSAAESATRENFRLAVKQAGAASENTRAAYKAMMGEARGVTWVDAIRTIGMGGTGWYV